MCVGAFVLAVCVRAGEKKKEQQLFSMGVGFVTHYEAEDPPPAMPAALDLGFWAPALHTGLTFCLWPTCNELSLGVGIKNLKTPNSPTLGRGCFFMATTGVLFKPVVSISLDVVTDAPDVIWYRASSSTKK